MACYHLPLMIGKLKSNATGTLIFLKDISVLSSAQQGKEATWISLWYDGKCNLLAIYYAWAIFVLLFNTMILNVASLGQKFLRYNVVMMGTCIDFLLIVQVNQPYSR